MSEKVQLNLQPSEAVIVQAAAQIFSAYIEIKAVNPENLEKLIEGSVHIAIKIAKLTDDLIKSDKEFQ